MNEDNDMSEQFSRFVSEIGRLSVEVERLKQERKSSLQYEIKLISATFEVRA